ncbi:hypothetical protein J1605_008595 [Eschrichtius robustus]|uniref:Uncharacterized protein n=1 Tax=Eschrichtius robustus TaxID=9764 RepID=A0AB34H053_ESCRO|nr:hypothetical protein J1605_008595 [Eschrichtius robustus]
MGVRTRVHLWHPGPHGAHAPHWRVQLAQPHLGGILDPRPGVVTKGFRTLDVDLDEVYCLNDFEEDDTGSRSYPSRPQAFPEEMQEPPAAEEEEEEEEEGSGEGIAITPVNLASLPEAEFRAILTSVPSTIRSGSLSVASARLCG